MKRILTLLALGVSFVAQAQIPGSTTVNSRYDWLGGHFKQLKLPAYSDTTDVPDWAPWLSGDAMLDTSGGNAGTIYVRYGSPRKWHAVSGSGSSSGGISEWIAGFGLTQVNDSTGAVDSLTITSRDRMYQQRDSLLALINLRMKYTDTASALSGYVRVGRFLDSLTAHQTRIQTKVAFTDTAAQTAGYTRVTRFLDSLTAHQTRIQTKVAFTDTATQMSGYVRAGRLIDTAAAIRSSITSSASLSPTSFEARYGNVIDLAGEDSSYHFGDSFSTDYGVTTGQGFNNIFASRFGLTMQNLAASGRGIWYAAQGANTNIYPRRNSKALTVMVGLNDLRRSQTAGTLRKLAAGIRSIIANNLIDSFYAMNNAAVTRTAGFTAVDLGPYGGKSGTLITGQGIFSNTATDSVTWTGTGTDFILGYLSNVTSGYTGGNVTIRVDGALYRTMNFDAADGVSDGANTNEICPGAVFIKGFARGVHTITVKNGSANYIYLDYFATVKTTGNIPPVIISLIPKMSTAGYATLGGSDAVWNTADDSIKAIVSEVGAYGVRYMDINKNYNVLTDVSSDDVHPSQNGYYKMADYMSTAVTKRGSSSSGGSGITSINALTGSIQTLAYAAAGTNVGWLSTGTSHTLQIPDAASANTRGLITNSLQTIDGEKHYLKGDQTFGAISNPSNGGAIEREYVGGIGYVSVLDRSGTTWKPIVFRSSTGDFNASGASIGGYSSSLVRFGNVSNPFTFYVDVTNSRVGIATSTPRSAFEMRAGTAKFVGPIGFSGSQILDSTGADIAFINRSDSIIKRMSVPALITLIGSSGATANTNLGSGFRILTPTAQGIKTLTGSGITIDSVTTGQLGLTNNLTSGISGGQTAIGGTGATDVLNIHATSANTTGTGIALNIGAKNTAGVPTESITINNAGLVGILTGATTPHSSLQVNGSFAWALSNVNQDLTMDGGAMMWRVDASGANRTITLPASPINFIGRVYVIKKSDATANTVTIVGTINGTSNRVLNTQHTGYILISNGTDWDIIGSF